MPDPGIDLACCWEYGETEPTEGLKRLKSLGFEGIELWPRFLEPDGAPQAWRQALSDTGVRCAQLCPYFDFVSGPEKIEESRRQLEQFLEYSRLLSCSRLRVFTGPVPLDRAVGASRATEAQWSAAIQSLQQFCDRALDEGVELCLECHEGMLMEDSEGALRLLTGVNRPNLTTNLQIPLLNEDWKTSVRNLGATTTHLHVHNWYGEPGDFGQSLTSLSEGSFDWQPVLTELVNKMGRRVCVSIEHLTHGGRDDPWRTAVRDGPFLTKLRKRVLGSPP
jgi:sugar phosphate isomerase/epimerase